ncbi:MAG: hypothetical protein KHY76_02015 [Butyricicoccus pullicaecorum]|nr:hypothetical protein [Butyricicoccus pullicaecorum]
MPETAYVRFWALFSALRGGHLEQPRLSDERMTYAGAYRQYLDELAGAW